MAGRRPRRPTEPLISHPIHSLGDAFRAALPRPAPTASREEKKNYAERLSRALAVLVANALRPTFPGIMPDAAGRSQETLVRTAKGYKRLDVNYSTPQLGLGLGVSIKTLNFPDPKNRRYTKNVRRIDNELRAEASDYHTRQPYSVLVAVLFLPVDACHDGVQAPSSFAHAAAVLRQRDVRGSPTDSPETMERIFIALYDPSSGDSCFFDVREDPPARGRPPPEACMPFEGFIEEVVRVFRERNP